MVKFHINTKLILKSTTIVLLAIVISSCKQPSQKTTTELTDDDEVLGFGTEEQLEEVFYRFPSPDEMLHYFENEQFQFTPHILLPVEKSKQFLDSRTQSYNLGVYMSDLAYLTLFNQNQQSHNYMLAVYGLAENLRISSAFDFALLKRMEDNMGELDSIKVVSREAMNSLNAYLEKNNKESTFFLMSIGGYIETMYLSFNLVGDYTEGNPFIQRISDQKFVLNNLINFGLRYAEDPEVSDALDLLIPIRSKFNEIVVRKTATKVEKDESGTLIISGGNKYEITEEQYSELRQIVFNTRQKITQYQ